MPLRAVESRSLADQVFEQVGTEIIAGRYPAGSSLPPERTLASVFNVNRHVVREALKRLEQLGLLKVSQGGGTKVLDYERTAGLDVLSLMADFARGGPDVAPYWLATLEMRSSTGADVARLCALRASQEIRDGLLQIAAEMDAIENDDQKLFGLEVRFWDRVLDGAGNIAYRLAFNTLLKGVFAIGDVSRQWSIEEIKQSGSRMKLARAIASGDAAKAEADTRVATRATAERFAAMAGLSAASRVPAKPAAAKKSASTRRAKK